MSQAITSRDRYWEAVVSYFLQKKAAVEELDQLITAADSYEVFCDFFDLLATAARPLQAFERYKMTIESLGARGVIHCHKDEFAGVSFWFEASTINEFIELQAENSESPFNKASLGGFKWVKRAVYGLLDAEYAVDSGMLITNTGQYATVPASDRSVSFSDNQPDVVDAFRQLNRFRDEFRGSNEDFGMSPIEKDALLRDLEVGAELEGQDEVPISKVKHFIIQPLRYFSIAVSGGALGQLGADLLRIFLGMLGLGS